MEKICFLLGNYFEYCKGGAELQAYYIARKIAENSELHYIFLRNPEHYKIKKFQKIDNGIILHTIRNQEYGIFGRPLFLNYWELLRLLDDLNPAFIYQRGTRAHIGIAARWCKKNNKKLVLGISMETNCSKSGILDLKNNFFNYPSKIIDGFFSFAGIKNSDLIIAQTIYQQKLLKQNFNRDSILIPNGHPVPLPPFKKVDPPIISWIGNIKLLKQPEIFIKLAENCKDLNARFVYAGRPAQGSYQNMLLKKTINLPNLRYLGEIPFDKTNELLSKSTVFVNTSLHEGFPNTYIQAWMRETPVIALNSDPDDLLKKKRIGYHSGNFDQMIKDLRFLIENEKERHAMGRRARKYAIENHNIEKIVGKYSEVFRNLIESR